MRPIYIFDYKQICLNTVNECWDKILNYGSTDVQAHCISKSSTRNQLGYAYLL